MSDELKCNRCETVLAEDSSVAGSSAGVVACPGAASKIHFALCGKCGLALREFLSPALETDELFQTVKAELYRRWS